MVNQQRWCRTNDAASGKSWREHAWLSPPVAYGPLSVIDRGGPNSFLLFGKGWAYARRFQGEKGNSDRVNVCTDVVRINKPRSLPLTHDFCPIHCIAWRISFGCMVLFLFWGTLFETVPQQLAALGARIALKSDSACCLLLLVLRHVTPVGAGSFPLPSFAANLPCKA